MPTRERTAPTGPLDRAVALLARVAQAPGGEVTVVELASDAGLPTSTAYRLVTTLARHGLVQRDGGAVSLGTRVVALGRAAEARLREAVVEPAAPVMERLARTLGESVILTAPCELDAIVLHTVEAEHPVRLTYAAFGRAPMHLGASGKVLAAFLDAAERERLLAAVDDPALEQALAEIRERGGAITSGEVDPGVTAVGAPVLDARGRLVAGLSVAGPSERLSDQRLDDAGEAVRLAARAVEAALRSRASSRSGR